MTGEKAPGGYICRVSPDGKTLGPRLDGLPQPVRHRLQPRRRAVHVRLRHGVGREYALVPAHAGAARHQRRPSSATATAPASGRPTTIDSLPPVVNVGPGSPTGITFGYGAQVPGEVPARPCTSATGATASSTPCTSSPKGSTYTGELEEFVAGTPLALTDVVVNPKDGAMYFAVGGRNTQSGLYRVTYDGAEPTGRGRAGRGAGDVRGPRPAARARAVPRPPRAEGRRGRLAVPGPPRPLHPMGRPGGDRVAGPGDPGASGPWPRRPAPRRRSTPCWP